MLNYESLQGFTIKGVNFDSDYGKDIYACFEFKFKNHLISVSTGEIQPSRNIKPVCLSEISIVNTITQQEDYICGTVEDAINFVIERDK